ncbi:MAG: dockerin type I domain-containing protein, partial [Myxococcota bacterium]
FSVWNFDVKRQDPACARVEVLPPLAGPGTSLSARVVVSGSFPTTRLVKLAAGRNALYNLPPNTDLSFYVPPASPVPLQVISTGAPWGGSGVPPAPYDACNAQIVFSSEMPGTVSGSVKLDYRASASGASADLLPALGGAAVATATVDESDRYSLTADSGLYTVVVGTPGYLSVQIPEAETRSGKINYQRCIKLRAGDVNGDATIDGADEALVVTQLGTVASPGDPADFNGDLVIDEADLAAVVANQGISGPLTAGDGYSSCFDNVVAEKSPTTTAPRKPAAIRSTATTSPSTTPMAR